jgi:hypothetical protein
VIGVGPEVDAGSVAWLEACAARCSTDAVVTEQTGATLVSTGTAIGGIIEPDADAFAALFSRETGALPKTTLFGGSTLASAGSAVVGRARRVDARAPAVDKPGIACRRADARVA